MSAKASVLAEFPDATSHVCGCGCGYVFIWTGPYYLGGWWSHSHAWRKTARNLPSLREWKQRLPHTTTATP